MRSLVTADDREQVEGEEKQEEEESGKKKRSGNEEAGLLMLHLGEGGGDGCPLM